MKKEETTVEKFNFKEALEKRGAKVTEDQERFLDAIREVLMTDSEEKETEEERANRINSIVEKQIKELRANDDLAKEFRALAKDVAKIQEAKLNIIPKEQRAKLRSYVKKNHKTIVDAIRSKKDLSFQVRAANPHYNDNGTISLGEELDMPLTENTDWNGGICELKLPENFVFDIIRNLNVGALDNLPESVVRTEQASKEGDASLVNEHSEKPLIQYKWVKNILQRVKFAGRIEWSEEFEADNNALFLGIVRMLENDVIRAWHNGTWTAITTNATPYTGGGTYQGIIPFGVGTVAEAAMVLQATIQAQNYDPDTVIVNPSDMLGVLLRMRDDGTFIPNPLFVDGRLNGMQVIESNTVTAGHVTVLDSSVFTERHTDYITRVGAYNDQFINNEWTLIGEVFSLLEFCEIDLVGVMHDSVSTILTDVEKPDPNA